MTTHDIPSLAERIPIAFSHAEYAQIYEKCSAAFRSEVNLEEFCSLAAEFHHDICFYQSQPASIACFGGVMRYVWIADNGKKGLSAALDQEGTIIGLRLAHLTEHPETDCVKSRFPYRLPFRGTWFTYWGGTNELVNYHYEYENQRYAYDFLMLKDGQTFGGDPLRCESYFAYGQPILAPNAGTVIRVENAVADNFPVGTMNAEKPAGNYVEIDHGHGEFSVLAHLKQASVTVAPGDRVERGDVIGLCGNSGNSSEPHLHFQVSNASDLYSAKSIPIRFENELEIVQGMSVTGKEYF